ncbi:MAG: 6-pyruvoyl tetrahydropterin synthase family protein [Sandaracinaceae bacterium]
MFSVEVRDHVMIAHSFRGEVFGPAQRLHGATYVVDVAWMRPELDPNGMVVDIARATEALRDTLAPLHYRNLDDLPEFEGVNTTTEVVAKHVFDRLAAALQEGRMGAHGDGVRRIRVTVAESHVAKASYEADL